MLVAKNHQKTQLRCLVCEFSLTDILNDTDYVYRAAILKKKYLWLLLFYMAVATYDYYEKVHRTMCIAIVLYLHNWLPIDQRFKQCLSTSVFKFFSVMCPQYMNEIYKAINQNNTVTRNSSLKLFQPLRTKALSQKCLSYLGPFIWNGLPDAVIKPSINLNTLKHEIKKSFLTLLIEKDQNIYVYYE